MTCWHVATVVINWNGARTHFLSFLNLKILILQAGSCHVQPYLGQNNIAILSIFWWEFEPFSETSWIVIETPDSNSSVLKHCINQYYSDFLIYLFYLLHNLRIYNWPQKSLLNCTPYDWGHIQSLCLKDLDFYRALSYV